MFSHSPDRCDSAAIRCVRALLTLVMLPATLAYGLPDDRDQPIHITADKALRDEKKGVTVYSGNVEMRQGSMELDADALAIYHDKEDADHIVAEGNPAKMRQRPELDQEQVHAHARVITYFKSEDRVHLQTDASIEQDGDLVTGDSIDYYIDKQLISAQSDQTREDDKVIVVIHPTPRDEKDSTAETDRADGPEKEQTPAPPPAQEDGSSGIAPAESGAAANTETQQESSSGATESE